MSATHDTTKDIATKTAGKPAEMELDTHELESTKAEPVLTPTKPRAVVGQPDTPNTATKKKTRTTVFITSARAGAGKTAGQRCDLTEELVVANKDTMDKIKSSPLRMKEQGLLKLIFDVKDTNESMASLHGEVHVAKAGFDGAATTFVLPKTANAGAFIHEWQSSVALYNHVAQQVNVETNEEVQKELEASLGKWPLPFVESEVAYETSVDRFKKTMPECADSCAVNLSVNISNATLIVKTIEWMRLCMDKT